MVPIQAWLLLDDGERALAAARRYGRKWILVHGKDFDEARFTTEAIALAHLGRVDEARALADSALAVNPEEVWVWDLPLLMTGHELRNAGDHAGARKVFEHVAKNLHDLRDTAGKAGAAEALYWAGRWDEATNLFRQLAGHPKFGVRAHGALGVLAARREDREEAEAADAWLSGVDPRHRRGEPSVWRARIAAALGEQERAVELIKQAFAEGQTQDYWGMYGPGMAWFRQDPHFETLRDLPAYQTLLRPRE